MDAFRVMLFLHVVAAVGLGAVFVLPFLQASAERSGVAATRFLLRAWQRVERMLVYPSMGVLLLFGLGMTFSDENSFGGELREIPGWLWGSLAWYVAVAAVELVVVRRDLADAIEALEGVHNDSAFPAEYVVLSRRLQIVSGLLGVSILGIAYLMVWGREGGF